MISGAAELSALVSLAIKRGRKHVRYGLQRSPADEVFAIGASCHSILQHIIEEHPPHTGIPYMIPYYRYDCVTYDAYANQLYYKGLGCHALPQLPPDQLRRDLSPTCLDRLAPIDLRPRCHSMRAKHPIKPITAIGLTLPSGTQSEEID